VTANIVKFPSEAGFFENREIVEVISEYDFPLIYTFYTRSTDFFLAYFCEHDEQENSVWLFVPTDPARIRRLFANEWSIRSFFQFSGSVYFARINNSTGNVVDIANYTTFEKIEGFLPDNSVYLDRKSAELTIKIDKPGLNPFTAPERLVTELVQDFRRALRSIMRELKDITPDLSDCGIPESLFGMPSINPGSLELVLKPSESSPLFYKSFEAINKVVSNEDADYLDENLKCVIKKNLLSICPNGRRIYNFKSINIKGCIIINSELNELSSVDFTMTETDSIKFREETREMNQQEKILTLRGIVQGFNQEYVELSIEENEFGIDKLKCNFDMDELTDCLRNESSFTFTDEQLNKPGQLIIHERVEITCDHNPNLRYAKMRKLTLIH
jgi:hypothetical protein